MTHTRSDIPHTRRSSAGELLTSPRRARTRARRPQHARGEHERLASYSDPQGRPRELVTQQGFAGSLLVIDRDAATGGDGRLIAHLASDEAAENAAVVCRHYLEDAPKKRCRFRRLTSEDARSAPFGEVDGGEEELGPETPWTRHGALAVDRYGCSYGLTQIQTAMSIPELRWCRHHPQSSREAAAPVSVREVVARLESYEPVRALTVRALAVHRADGELSTTALRAELNRLQGSPIVLNRGLREAALARIEREGLSMSQIALRCGRVKRDSKGHASGETSWLARRLGLLPEGGQRAPTPWIHSDVLALIARRGLGIAPRDVEL